MIAPAQTPGSGYFCATKHAPWLLRERGCCLSSSGNGCSAELLSPVPGRESQLRPGPAQALGPLWAVYEQQLELGDKNALATGSWEAQLGPSPKQGSLELPSRAFRVGLGLVWAQGERRA